MTPSTRSPSAHPALSSAYVRVIAHYALATLMVVVVTVSLWLLRDLWPMSGPARMQLLARMTALALTVGVLGLAG